MKIVIPLPPTGQQRPRFTKIGRFHKAYKSKKQKQEEEKISFFLLKHRPEKPFSGAVSIKIDAYLPIPTSWSKKKQEAAKEGKIKPVKKPDVDNLAKQILDVMNKVYFEDDKQIVELYVSKNYSTEPRWEIEIKTLTKEEDHEK